VSAGPLVDRNLDNLAPKFAAVVRAAIDECNRNGLDAFVYEAMRSDALQKFYFAQGRTIIPPHDTVTNASSSRTSWHGYGLAVDVISRANDWSVTAEWQDAVANIFLTHECKWGGHFTKADNPHFQWGRCKASPSPLARQILDAEGLIGVWRAVGAL
jgi:peptidoglycan L-alanyl-D-glutamate endopeptidase CwlK